MTHHATTTIDVASHLPLAKWIAGRIVRKWPRLRRDFEDVLAQANLCLVDAARRFEPARGVQFSTFATHRIYVLMRVWALREYVRHQHRGEVPLTSEIDVETRHQRFRQVDDTDAVESAIGAARLWPSQEGVVRRLLAGDSAADVSASSGRSLEAIHASKRRAFRIVRDAYLRQMGEGDGKMEGRRPRRDSRKARHGPHGKRSLPKRQCTA